MSYKTVFNDIMRLYEAERDCAAALLRQRRGEIYGKIPRIKEIDFELSQIGISAAKKLLFNIGNFDDADSLDAERPNIVSNNILETMRMTSEALKKEKKQLLTNNGISVNYLSDVHKCGVCKDTGWVNFDTRAAERCHCLTQRLIDRYYDLSNIRNILDEENFGTFNFDYYSENVDPSNGLSPKRNIELINKTAQDFVIKFDSTFQNLLFYGATGLGKTFMCNCIAKELLDRGRTVLYVTAPGIFKIVEEYRFNRDDMDEREYIIDAVTEVDLLILDDLGAEFDTIVTSAALFDIINSRLLGKKPTVISTNLTPAEFEFQYSDRIVSRFLGDFKLSKFYGEDIRSKKKYVKGDKINV